MTPLSSDVRLARRAAAGDERAFAQIYERYHQALYRFCLSILGKPEDAQDALQNTMVKALRALPGEEREIQLKPWLYRIAHNESIELLRRHRDQVELDPQRAASSAELAETVAARERLAQLIADLGELPERQRSALVMRELGGLGFAEIGEAFKTSDSVARQTVYEARLSLRQLEEGREMSCEKVTRQLSDADGRVLRRRDVQAHLRSCPDCSAFRDAIDSRHRDLAALSPLPTMAAASILQGLLTGGGSAVTGGGVAGAAGAAAGKVAMTSGVIKSVAAVAVVTAIGVGAADRGGLIDAGLPGGKAEPSQTAPAAAPIDSGNSAASGGGNAASGQIDSPSSEPSNLGGAEGRVAAQGAPTTTKPAGATPAAEPVKGPPEDLPAASQHGQETAAAHKADGRSPVKDNSPGNSSGGDSAGDGKGAQGARAHGSPPMSPGKSKSTSPQAQQGGRPETKPPPGSHSQKAIGATPPAAVEETAATGPQGNKGGGPKSESSP